MSCTARTVCLIAVAVAGCSKGGGGERGRAIFLNDRPIAGSPVRVTGCPDRSTADDGTFDTSCAAPRYDVALRYGNVGIVYQGLSRRDPVITLPYPLGLPRSVTASGTVSGLTPGRVAAVALTSPSFSPPLTTVSGGAYSTSFFWLEGTSPAVTARALEWTEVAGVRTAYTAYGEATFVPRIGVDPVASPALSPVGSAAISLRTDAADGSGLVFALWASWPDGGATELAAASPGTTDITFASPAVAGTTFAALAERTQVATAWAWRRGLAATSAPSPVALPADVAFAAPPSGATVDLATDFIFPGLSGAVFLVGFESSRLGGPLLYVVTRETRVRIPDFSWAGQALQSGEAVGVRLLAQGPCPSMDEAATGPAVLELHPTLWLSFGGRVPASDGFATRYVMPVTMR